MTATLGEYARDATGARHERDGLNTGWMRQNPFNALIRQKTYLKKPVFIIICPHLTSFRRWRAAASAKDVHRLYILKIASRKEN
jgi:hypothetical protein